MKVVKKELPTPFIPIEVTFTIESETELNTLSNLFNNVSATRFEEAVKYHSNVYLNLDVIRIFIQKIGNVLNKKT